MGISLFRFPELFFQIFLDLPQFFRVIVVDCLGNILIPSIHPFEDFFQHFFNSVEALVKVLLDGGIQSFDF